jgi:hypothetical protein
MGARPSRIVSPAAGASLRSPAGGGYPEFFAGLISGKLSRKATTG